jgi:AraC-like DNA-binding protein
MDVVSDAIAVMRTGQPSATRAAAGRSWRLRFAPYRGAGFHVLLRGHCWLFPEEGDPIEMSVGDVVVLSRGSGHDLSDTAGGSARDAVPFERWDGRAPDARAPVVSELLCGKYRLDSSRAHPLMAELPEVLHVPAGAGRHPQLQAVVGLLGHEMQHRDPGHDAALSGLLDLLLVYVLRGWLTDRPDVAWSRALTDPVVAAALQALHEDPARPWSIATLGERVGLSRAPLTRRFTALVGRPPMAYLAWWRMTSAARLLRETDLPLASIAAQVGGYRSAYAFSHAFKRQFGCPPGQYRATATSAELPAQAM